MTISMGEFEAFLDHVDREHAAKLDQMAAIQLVKELEQQNAMSRIESQEATIKELRAFIDEQGLADQVSKGVGGKKRRTKRDMTDDIMRALKDHPSRMPTNEF